MGKIYIGQKMIRGRP